MGADMLTKVCNKCNCEKSIDSFQKQKDGKHGVRPECKDCSSLKKKEYYLRNKQKIQEYQRLNKDSIDSRRKTYLNENKEYISDRHRNYYDKNRDHILEVKKQWRLQNKDKANTSTAKRRALKLQATPSWVDHDIVSGMYELAVLFNNVGMSMQVDHIVPLQSSLVCGLHCQDNLQLLLSSDNNSKGNRYWPDQW